MTGESFLDGKVQLFAGDCLDVLKTLEPSSVDSIVTDPPYGLEFMGKGWDGADGFRRSLNRADAGRDNVFGRASKRGPEYRAGFLFQEFMHAIAIECLRVLKPGAHLVAFGGTRTYHRMASAIEDAGFEIRDSIQWLYGSGFPKSLDVSKAIDKAAGAERKVVAKVTSPFKVDQAERARLAYGEYNAGIDGDGYRFNTITAPATDAARQWAGFGTSLKPACEPIVLARKPLSESTVAANVLRWGCGALNIDACRVGVSSQPHSPARDADHDSREDSRLCTCPSPTGDRMSRTTGTHNPPSSASPRQQQSGHSSNAERNGRDDQQSQGSLNDCRPSDDSCGEHTRQYEDHGQARAEQEGDARKSHVLDDGRQRNHDDLSRPCPIHTTPDIQRQGNGGRWPANVIHDGSDEVVGAFPQADGPAGAARPESVGTGNGVTYMPTKPQGTIYAGEKGSAARFFYTAKADADDRLGSKHPTVKPLDLMQYLVRLVTPPKGLVLDPFAGTGTTGEAAWREGFNAVLIEREEEYQNDIRRRMALCLSGPAERKRESIKARAPEKPFEAGTLFA